MNLQLHQATLAFLAAATMHAQPLGSWQDLPGAIYKASKADKHLKFTLTLVSGQERTTDHFNFTGGALWMPGDSRPLEREEVAEIVARHRGRLFSLIEFDVDPFDLPADIILLPFALALDAVTTPPVMFTECIRRIGSTKVLYRAP